MTGNYSVTVSAHLSVKLNNRRQQNRVTAAMRNMEHSACLMCQAMSNTQPYTVMTVCTGNICRSPMGEIILRHFFNERGLGDQVNVESSGVSDEEWSHPIDPRAVRVLRERGYGDEIPRDHFAHRISREEIDRTDLFLPMTASHMRALLRMLPAGKRAEVHMYRSFDPNLPKPAAGREDSIDLVDPWYGGPREFEVAIDQIEEVAPYIVDWVEQQLQN